MAPEPPSSPTHSPLKNLNGLTPWPLGPSLAAAVASLAVAAALLPRLLPPNLLPPLLLAALSPFLIALLHVFFNPLERWRHRRVPGYPYKAPFGNLPDIVRAGGLPHLAVEGAKLYGPTFKVWRGQVCIVVTADPDATKKIGARLSARGAGQGGGGAAGDPLGLGLANPKATGLLLADGERFTMLKRAWQPAFAPSSLKAYAPLLKKAADGAVARLRAEVERASKAADGGAAAAVCDVHAVLAGMTMAAVGSCAFGVDWGTLSSSDEENDDAEKKEQQKNKAPAADESGSDDGDDALNNGGAKSPTATKTAALDREWRRMGRMLVGAAEEIFGGTRLSQASRWSLLAMAWPWATPLVRWLARRFPDKALVRRVEARQRLDAASRFLIEHARKDIEANKLRLEGQGGGGDDHATTMKKKKASGVTGIEPGSFLAALMREGAGLTTDDVSMQAQTFMLAGFETTLSTLGFAVALLARHPDKARALHRAIDAADAARQKRRSDAGDAEDAEEVDADACIPYANAVLDEAMRLYPPGTAVARSPASAALIHAARGGEDASAASASASAAPALVLPSRPGQPPIVVPPTNRLVQGVLFAVHRSPDVWPRADEFLPERFLPEGHPGLADPSLKAASPNAFLPFGCGARMCIGYRFALLEARTALVALFRSFEFEVAEGPGCGKGAAMAGGFDAAAAAAAAASGAGASGPGVAAAAAAAAAAAEIKTATGITMGPDGGVWCAVRARKAAGRAEE